MSVLLSLSKEGTAMLLSVSKERAATPLLNLSKERAAMLRHASIMPA